MIPLNDPANAPLVPRAPTETIARAHSRTAAPPACEPVPEYEAPNQPRLLDQLRNRMRVKHYSIRTEEAYVDWVRRYILFHHKVHPRELGSSDIEAFLTHLAWIIHEDAPVCRQ
jgi:hypothetical protein